MKASRAALVSKLGLGLLVIHLVYSTIPTVWTETQQALDHLAMARSDLVRVQQFVGNLENMREEIKALDARLEIAHQHLPSDWDLPGLLRKFALLSEHAGVELSAFRPNQQGTQQPFPVVQVVPNGGPAPGSPPMNSNGALAPPAPPGGAPSEAGVVGSQSRLGAGQPRALASSFLDTVEIHVTLRGTFSQFLLFLDQVASLNQIVQTQTIHITPLAAADEVKEGAHHEPTEAEVVFTAYRFRTS